MNQIMNCLLKPQNFDDWERKSFTIIDQFLPEQVAKNLCFEFQDRNLFKPAQIGRSGNNAALTQNIRSDSIRWIDLKENAPEVLLTVDQLKLELNQNLFLGLDDFECHLAHYQDGQHYDFHIDEPQTGFSFTSRSVSFVLYLNPNWQPTHAGRLLIQDKNGLLTIEPLWNRAVLFDSKTVLHAVEKSLAPRQSLTGWFRNRR